MVNCQEYTGLLRSCSKQYKHLIGHLKTLPHDEPGSIVVPNAVGLMEIAGSSLLIYFASLFFFNCNIRIVHMSFVLEFRRGLTLS